MSELKERDVFRFVNDNSHLWQASADAERESEGSNLWMIKGIEYHKDGDV